MRTKLDILMPALMGVLILMAFGIIVFFILTLATDNTSTSTAAIEAVPEIELMPIPIVAPGPTLTVSSGTYTETEYADRVARSIETYGFRNVCILHVQNLALGTLPYRGFDRDTYRALAFYAAACADLLENYLPEDYLLEETGS